MNLLRCSRAHPPPASPHPTLCTEDRRKQTQQAVRSQAVLEAGEKSRDCRAWWPGVDNMGWEVPLFISERGLAQRQCPGDRAQALPLPLPLRTGC